MLLVCAIGLIIGRIYPLTIGTIFRQFLTGCGSIAVVCLNILVICERYEDTSMTKTVSLVGLVTFVTLFFGFIIAPTILLLRRQEGYLVTRMSSIEGTACTGNKEDEIFSYVYVQFKVVLYSKPRPYLVGMTEAV